MTATAPKQTGSEDERNKKLVESAMKKLTKAEFKAVFDLGNFLGDPLSMELLEKLAE